MSGTNIPRQGESSLDPESVGALNLRVGEECTVCFSSNGGGSRLGWVLCLDSEKITIGFRLAGFDPYVIPRKDTKRNPETQMLEVDEKDDVHPNTVALRNLVAKRIRDNLFHGRTGKVY